MLPFFLPCFPPCFVRQPSQRLQATSVLSWRRGPYPSAPLPTRDTPYRTQRVRDMAAMSLSAEALAGIVSATEAAYFAARKMRHARAAELFGRAVEHAFAAGVQSDSLILASLRLYRGIQLFPLARETGITASATAIRTEAWTIMCEVMRVFRARDQAGTLLPGTLRSDEVAYAEAHLHAMLRFVSAELLLHDESLCAKLKSEAPLFGYDHLLLCAQQALTELLLDRYLQTTPVLDNSWPLMAGAEVEAAQSVVLRALALMTEVQHDNTHATVVFEAQLVTLVADTLIPDRRARTRGVMLTAQFYDELFAAWNTPALHAALRLRGTMDYIHTGDLARSFAAEEARQAADVAAVGLHTCALPACGAREVSVHQFKRCGGCKAVVYCSAACAKAHWKAGHKRECSRGALPAQPNK